MPSNRNLPQCIHFHLSLPSYVALSFCSTCHCHHHHPCCYFDYYPLLRILFAHFYFLCRKQRKKISSGKKPIICFFFSFLFRFVSNYIPTEWQTLDFEMKIRVILCRRVHLWHAHCSPMNTWALEHSFFDCTRRARERQRKCHSLEQEKETYKELWHSSTRSIPFYTFYFISIHLISN